MSPVLALRYKRGLTQAAVAEGAGVSRGTLWAIERGTTPSAPVAAKLATFFDVPVEQILGFEPLASEVVAG